MDCPACKGYGCIYDEDDISEACSWCGSTGKIDAEAFEDFHKAYPFIARPNAQANGREASR